MRLLNLSVVLVAVIGITAVGAQNNDPTTSSLRRITGVVKAVSASSLSLEFGDKEIVFTSDVSFSVINPGGKGTMTNDLVYRGSRPRKLTDYVKRGDRVTITCRESGDVLHIMQIRVHQK